MNDTNTKNAAIRIAEELYPDDFVKHGNFNIDNNAGKRAVAKEVAYMFLCKLEDKSVVEGIMKAFYRRVTDTEVHVDDIAQYTTYMNTSLTMYKDSLTEQSR